MVENLFRLFQSSPGDQKNKETGRLLVYITKKSYENSMFSCSSAPKWRL